MKEKIDRIMSEIMKMDKNSKFIFKNMCGLTFVYEETFFMCGEKISSAEMKPVGIIYEENDDFYFAPLDEIDKIEPIIKEFVAFMVK